MTDPSELDDDALFALVARAVGEALPPEVVAAALGAETWRTIDAELAELVFDSAVEAAGTRRAPGSGPRELTFRAGDVEVELLVTDDGGLAGQVVPAGATEVEVVTAAGSPSAPASVDDLGRFSFAAAAVPAGPVRLRVRTAGGWVHTSWVTLRGR